METFRRHRKIKYECPRPPQIQWGCSTGRVPFQSKYSNDAFIFCIVFCFGLLWIRLHINMCSLSVLISASVEKASYPARGRIARLATLTRPWPSLCKSFTKTEYYNGSSTTKLDQQSRSAAARAPHPPLFIFRTPGNTPRDKWRTRPARASLRPSPSHALTTIAEKTRRSTIHS